MAFWSAEKLEARLPALLGSQFDRDCVKSARYALHIGGEAFVTSSTASGGPRKGVTFSLKPNEAFKIPAGQFAFLLTEENIEVPTDALALISIKTHLKYMGLINVSGFHVDPGWKGHLKFGIYNAGPGDVELRRGQEMFLIWYADLDRKSERPYKKSQAKGAPHIPPEYANSMQGQMYSPQILAGLIRKLQSRLLATWYIAGTILAAVILIAASQFLERKSPPVIVVPQIAQPPSPSIPSSKAAGQGNSDTTSEPTATAPTNRSAATPTNQSAPTPERKSVNARSAEPKPK